VIDNVNRIIIYPQIQADITIGYHVFPGKFSECYVEQPDNYHFFHPSYPESLVQAREMCKRYQLSVYKDECIEYLSNEKIVRQLMTKLKEISQK